MLHQGVNVEGMEAYTHQVTLLLAQGLPNEFAF